MRRGEMWVVTWLEDNWMGQLRETLPPCQIGPNTAQTWHSTAFASIAMVLFVLYRNHLFSHLFLSAGFSRTSLWSLSPRSWCHGPVWKTEQSGQVCTKSTKRQREVERAQGVCKQP